jgi:hypothetical protein
MTFRWLLRIAEYLDRRFPPKVVVTQEVFEALSAKTHKNAKEIAALQGEQMVLRDRLAGAEKSLAAVKEALTKGGSPATAAVKDRLREDFIKGEGEAWSGRPQAPAPKPVVEAAS